MKSDARPLERLITIEISFSEREIAVVAELRARLRLESDADVMRVALWVYADGQGLRPAPSLFAVGLDAPSPPRVPRGTRKL